jgi:Uma2 family endonuclease
MTALTVPSPNRGPGVRETETIADLLERLGNIPSSRVRPHPEPGKATEADVVAIEARESRLFELIDGVLVEKCMGYAESLLAMAIGDVLRAWVKPRDLGFVSGEAGMMRIAPNLVCIPDVAFVSRKRLPGGKRPEGPVPGVVPDLAVEVLSESNTAKEMERKRADYIKAGVELIWEFDPVGRVVEVYTEPAHSQRLTESDVLDGGEVLPGFTVSLRDLFAELNP